ncbi:TetR/AcrR family transcriptional regulator [Prescottella soli]|uniref:TetR/AcrR family transcriptional regulator n=1 Tax=Prescottella soli TaxID=1543852 RepID=A0ABW9FXI8_9NOCA
MTDLGPDTGEQALDGRSASRRSRAKADRRRELLRAAARLVAERGFSGVRLEDLGAAVGISGPAVYRHFPNKDALLIELLTDISRRLFEGGTAVVAEARTAPEALSGLIEFHLDFVLTEPDLIRVQDRELGSLPESDRRLVRQYQRRYVEAWVEILRQVDPELDEVEARVKAHATFGLLNSTPHSANRTSPTRTRDVLRRMTTAALAAGV